jgi:hypothetical protein
VVITTTNNNGDNPGISTDSIPCNGTALVTVRAYQA